MGKSRRRGGDTPDGTQNGSSDDFETSIGNKVPLNGYSRDTLEQLQSAINSWIGWGGVGIERRFPNYDYNNPEQNDLLNYVLDSMETTSDHLYRLERMERTFLEQNLEVGKYFNFKDKVKTVDEYKSDIARLKAFSKTINGSEFLMDSWYKNNDDQLVLFRTNGDVKYFDTTKWNNKYPEEEEVWVGSTYGKDWEVTGINHETVNGRDVLVVDIM